jgi:electron transfer flavoprotein beta subunit
VFTDAELTPAKPRPKRLKVIKAKSGADRMKAATAKASGGGGQVLKGVTAQEGAAAILKLLVEEGGGALNRTVSIGKGVLSGAFFA